MKGPLGTVGKRDPPRGRFSEIHRKPHFGAGWARATFPRPGELLCPQRLSALSGGEKPARIWVSPVAGPDPQSPRKRFQREQNRLRDTRPCRGGGSPRPGPNSTPGPPLGSIFPGAMEKTQRGRPPPFFEKDRGNQAGGGGRQPLFSNRKAQPPPGGPFVFFFFSKGTLAIIITLAWEKKKAAALQEKKPGRGFHIFHSPGTRPSIFPRPPLRAGERRHRAAGLRTRFPTPRGAAPPGKGAALQTIAEGKTKGGQGGPRRNPQAPTPRTRQIPEGPFPDARGLRSGNPFSNGGKRK